VTLERLVPGSATAAAAEARRVRAAAERLGPPPEPAAVARGALLDTPSRASSLLDTSFAGGPAAIPVAVAAPEALALPPPESLAPPAVDPSLADEVTLVAATSSTGDGSAAAMLLPLGGVGGIFLLLMVQGLVARRPTRRAGRQSD
jgi:hypothetical protein